jgi:hypothetical protein
MLATCEASASKRARGRQSDRLKQGRKGDEEEGGEVRGWVWEPEQEIALAVASGTYLDQILAFRFLNKRL